MSKTIAPKPTEEVNAQSPVESAADKQALIKAQAEKEWQELIAARQAFNAKLSATGQINLERAAREMGQSVDKFGYPSPESYQTFTGLAVHQKAVSHNRFDALASLARNSVGTKLSDGTESKLTREEADAARDKFVTGKAKRDGNGAGSKSTIKIKAPRAFDVALGG